MQREAPPCHCDRRSRLGGVGLASVRPKQHGREDHLAIASFPRVPDFSPCLVDLNFLLHLPRNVGVQRARGGTLHPLVIDAGLLVALLNRAVVVKLENYLDLVRKLYYWV